MTRAGLDAAFAAAAERKSAALTAGDGAAVCAASAEILALAREILAGVTSAGRPARLLPAQDAALFWAAWHPVKFAPAGKGAEAMVALADAVEWMESIGHVFPPKERKIVDGLPFSGVPELFRRWAARQTAQGFGGNPAEGVKTVFNWYRDRPEEEVPEEFVRYLAENLDRDRQWFPFYYGAILSRLGRGQEGAKARAREAKEKPTDFRRWIALAECYAAVPRRIVACLAKALTCTILPADEAPAIRASLEKRLRAAARLAGRPAPARLDARALEALAAPTHTFLISNVPVVKGVLAGVKTAKDGRQLAEISYTDATGATVVRTVPMAPALERRPRGTPLKLRVVRHGDLDRIIEAVPLSPASPSAPRGGARSAKKTGACGSRRRNRT